MNNQILINAISNYDRLLKESSNYEIKYDNNKYILKNKINLDNINKKFNIDCIGVYNKKDKIWVWGYVFDNTKCSKLWEWAIARKNKQETIIDKIINTTLINSKFIISDEIQLDIILSLATYLFKTDIIFTNDVFSSILE